MADSMVVNHEADRLYAVLTADDVPKKVMLSGFVEYSEASKNEVVARIARTFAPIPAGVLLARLLYIRTSQNETPMRIIFLANLRSPHAEARRISLFGLKELEHPLLSDLALLSMRDDSDQVLAIALDILLPHAKADRNLRAFLQGFYLAHKGQEAFHMSVSLLEAHGIASPSLADQ